MVKQALCAFILHAISPVKYTKHRFFLTMCVFLNGWVNCAVNESVVDGSYDIHVQ